MIYYLKEGREYNQKAVDRMKGDILKAQQLFGQQMEANGHGFMTFDVDVDDSGEPTVFVVKEDAAHENNPYTILGFHSQYDFYKHTYWIVIDNGLKRIGGNSGESFYGISSKTRKWEYGYAATTADYRYSVLVHELGHAFGLKHDFRSKSYIMSYGLDRRELAKGNANFLAMSPAFNPNVSLDTYKHRYHTEVDRPTKDYSFEVLSDTTYSRSDTSVEVEVRINVANGLQDALMFVTNKDIIGYAVIGYDEFDGETDAILSFDYPGVPVYDNTRNHGYTKLTDVDEHRITIQTIDAKGNIVSALVRLTLNREDLNGDGIVNVLDLVIAANALRDGYDERADVNQDGVINILDLTLISQSIQEQNLGK